MDIRPYNEQTFEDAKIIVKKRFGETACLLLRHLLDNPLLSFCPSAGDIAYKDGKPVVFQAAILKRLFMGNQEIFGVNGAMFCKMPGVSLRYVLAVSDRTNSSRAGSRIAFGNTAMPVSTGMALASDSVAGPDSCATIRFSIIRLGGFLNFMAHGKLPRILLKLLDSLSVGWGKLLGANKVDVQVRRVMSLEELDINDFWKRYLDGNRGLVSSRTKEELNWVFGDRVKQESVLFFVFVENGMIMGYVAIKRQGEGSGRWMIIDWIAVNDDSRVLKKLLFSAKAYLYRIEGAAFVEIIGYPMFAQRIIKKVFMFNRKAPGNSFTYRIDDVNFRKKFDLVKDVSWFFGAYDGDRCL